MELLHLTDMHLLADPRACLHGWRVEDSFERVLDDAVARYPHHAALVLGGDLIDDESIAGYRRLNARLAAWGRPVLAMAGNHDDPRRAERRLTHAVVHGRLRLGDLTLIALDSHVDGHAYGRLGSAQYHMLVRELAETTGPALVFVHHPPCRLDSDWLDAMRLIGGRALLDRLAERAAPSALVCGHAHQAAYRRSRGVDCWVTPSTMRQFLPYSETFAEDRRRAPGYRWIRVHADGRFETRVHRVPTAAPACG